MVVPILRDTQNAIEVCFTDDAKGVEHLVFERLDHSLHEGLQIGRLDRRPFDLPARRREYFVERSNVLRVLIAPDNGALQILVLEVYLKIPTC